MVGGAWKPIEELSPGDAVVAFDSEVRPGVRRRFVETNVTTTVKKRDSLIEFSTVKGLIASTPDHEWLVQRRGLMQGGHKVKAADVRVGDRLYWLSEPDTTDPTCDPEFRAGWLAGYVEGDGSFGRNFFRVYSKETGPLDRFDEYARAIAGVGTNRILVTRKSGPQLGYELWHANIAAGSLGLEEARSRMRAIVERDPALESDMFARGWLSGMFDAEGTATQLTICQKSQTMADRVAACWRRFGFDPSATLVRREDGRSAWQVSIRGGLRETQRFATLCRPALSRKVTLSGRAVSTTSLESVEVTATRALPEPVDVYDVTTGAQTFVVGGFLAWECYQGADHSAELVERRGLRQFMTAEVLERALPWAIQWTRKELGIALYGGEPLLAWPLVREQLPRWTLAFAEAGKQVRFSCTTNGTLLSEEVRSFFDEHQVGLLLSLDGPARVHDQLRTYVNGRPSWESIHPLELLAWRPNLEIAWLLDPERDWSVADLDWMIEHGFRNINFNLQWLSRWPAEAQLRLQRFMEAVYLRCARGALRSNMPAKLTKSLVGEREDQPCGTGMHMVAVTPEGWLYPSQEMAFTVFEEGRAPGTPEHYRIGNVFASPVIDVARLADVSQIRNDQMKPPEGYECATCVAKASCFGGCHCRYVGGDGISAAHRFDVSVGLCESTVASVTGMLRGAAVGKRVVPVIQVQNNKEASCRPAGLAAIAGWGR